MGDSDDEGQQVVVASRPNLPSHGGAQQENVPGGGASAAHQDDSEDGEALAAALRQQKEEELRDIGSKAAARDEWLQQPLEDGDKILILYNQEVYEARVTPAVTPPNHVRNGWIKWVRAHVVLGAKG